ncbi:flavin reductase family protein [Congregibacter variabilis]|uniref:Flavin reductase family protein n=1 Tax=Congregibacter variabilis TaxID=3081200 RepID=A0ABZ0I290_9GAMM|nr:flavin reductase family protein [Congregibacter sp. IMCC43200]
MYYETATNDHGLPHDPLKALVAPRPIGWISSLDADGTPNLAPYSFFNLLATGPAIVGFSSGSKKDSQRNIEVTGDFVCNFTSVDLIDKVNATAKHVAAHVNEFELAGLTQVESRLIKAPRVAQARAHLECRYLKTVELPGEEESEMIWSLVLGQVVAVHIDDSYLKNGLVDTLAMEPLTRMGYLDYGVLGGMMTRERP